MHIRAQALLSCVPRRQECEALYSHALPATGPCHLQRPLMLLHVKHNASIVDVVMLHSQVCDMAVHDLWKIGDQPLGSTAVCAEPRMVGADSLIYDGLSQVGLAVKLSLRRGSLSGVTAQLRTQVLDPVCGICKQEVADLQASSRKAITPA